MMDAVMEAGQILHNNPTGYQCPDYVEALLVAIRSEIARVYWNTQQRPWLGAGRGDIGSGGGYDPVITLDPLPPGIEWHEYYNWGGCPDDADC
jgi:hypothetical protein